MYIDPEITGKRGNRTQPFSRSSSFTSSMPWGLLANAAPNLNTTFPKSARLFSTARNILRKDDDARTQHPPKLTHISDSGSAHMVSISDKTPTKRVAVAKCSVRFSDATVVPLIRANQVKKGDVLGVARIAGIMAAKRTADLIPLCHPIAISHVSVELDVLEPGAGDRPTTTGRGGGGGAEGGYYGVIDITATVACDGKTGVEMEALTAASTAALTVYDMCKAVDKGMVVDGLRVVLKEGGKSGRWVEGSRVSAE